ncbi:unnamed protein product [Bathycoccus prasinos]
MPRRDQEALLLQNSIAEEESSMGTQIPLAKSTSVTLFQHHHQGEGEKQQQFLGQNLEERDSLVLVVNDHQIAAEKDGDLEKPLSHVLDARLHRHPKKILERLVLSNRICNDCQTTQTHSDWYRSKVVKGTYLCDKCYYVELLKVQNRECNDCGSSKTSIAWSKSKRFPGKFVCQRCYTSSKWIKSKVILGADLCVNCYNKEKLSLSNKQCGVCASRKSSMAGWYKSKKTPGVDLCNSCYKVERNSMANKVCNDCKTTKTSQWAKSKTTVGVDLCLKCYSKERSLLKTLTAAATGQTNE